MSCLTVFAENTNSYSSNSKENYDYKITAYNVDIKVDYEGTYHVTENMDVYFSKERHGIYRDIPVLNYIEQEDGNTKLAKAKVKILQCSDDYSISRKGDNLRVKIGDAKKKFTGKKTFSISYAYALQNDIFSKNDIFYFGVIGTSDTTIANAKFSIQMPKPFDENNLDILYRKNNSDNSSKMSYYIDKNTNTIYGKLDSNIALDSNEGVTVRLNLPKGYFHKVVMFPIVAIMSMLIGGLTILLSYLLWRKYIKEESAGRTIEAYSSERKEKIKAKGSGLRNITLCMLSFVTVFLATFKPLLDYTYNAYTSYFFAITSGITVVAMFTLFYRVKNIFAKIISMTVILLLGVFFVLFTIIASFNVYPVYVMAVVFSIVVSGISSHYSAKTRYKQFLTTDTPTIR